MKIRSVVKIIALILCFSFCFSAVSVYAVETSSKIVEQYSADFAYGKIFVDGENQTVKNSNQLDTMISNIGIYCQGDSYILKFRYNSSNIEIPYEMVQAKANNVNGDHYLLSPLDFHSEQFDCVSISFTTCANDYDLMPVNSQFIGSPVLSIIFEEKNTSDIYYWQVPLNAKTRETPTFKTSTSEDTVQNANEFYYVKESNTADIGSSADFPEEDLASAEEYELYKSRDYTAMTRSSHNPYYDLGIPDSTFKTATESWRWLAAGLDSDGEQLPIRYYAYSYTKFGNPNIMTHIMIVGHTWQRDQSGTPFQAEDGLTYSRAKMHLQVELFTMPHTVIYYTESNSFGFMLGGEKLTQIVEPAIKIQKASTNIPHLLVGRYEYANAVKKGIFGLKLGEVVVGVLDEVTYGFMSVFLDIAELINGAGDSVGGGISDSPKEAYYSPNAHTQIKKYGYAMGSLKSELKGYLREKDHFFGLQAWFATPDANKNQVTNCTWVYYVSAGMR